MKDGTDRERSDACREYPLKQFYQVFALLKVSEHLRKEWLKPLGKRGIGAIADSHPDNRCFVRGGQQEPVFKVFIFGDDCMLIRYGIVPDCFITCEE